MKELLSSIVLLILLSFAGCQSGSSSHKQRPLIGLSCSHPSDYSSARTTYTESVIQAGGIPILIPVTTDSIVLADIISRLDGIILIGGADIHPSYYNEEPIEQLGEVDSLRDVYDISLIRLAAQRGVPMLGICRGEQLINVAFGGTLYQDIPTQHPDTTVRHNQEGPSSVPTHAVKQVAPGFRITAWATDSIPEAIENIEGKPIWGVQFHPEALTVAGDSISARFFYFLVDKAITFRKSK